MNITNKHSLPEPILRAAEDSINSHPPRDKSRSVTQLISSPRIYQLNKRHWDDLEQDVTDIIKPMIGTAWHSHLEGFGSDDDVVEWKVQTMVGDWCITGTIDLYNKKTKTITDYKTASVFSYLLGEKKDYIAQINLYRYLLERSTPKPESVSALQLAYTFTDWQWRKNVSDDYPDAPAKVVPIEMWSMEDTEKFIRERLELHKAAEEVDDGSLPECTDEEMWAKAETFAVKKPGRKTALRVLSSRTEAEDWIGTQNGLTVEHRPGERTRCERFCILSKNNKCSQWAKFAEERQ